MRRELVNDAGRRRAAAHRGYCVGWIVSSPVERSVIV